MAQLQTVIRICLLFSSSQCFSPFRDSPSRRRENVIPTAPSKTRRSIPTTQLPLLGDDYEFIPPENPTPFAFDTEELTSSYPDGTPANLRGEAVRSALRSGQCLGWKFDTETNSDHNSPLQFGVVKVQGKGCREFLNNKFTSSFPELKPESSSNSKHYFFTETCLLNGKGRVMDRLGVILLASSGSEEDEAYLISSPGHAPQTLFDRLDPYIFPMDRVELKIVPNVCIFDLVSTTVEDVQTVLREQLGPRLGITWSAEFPVIPSSSYSSGSAVLEHDILIVPSIGLQPCAAVGYTLIFLDRPTGERSWAFLTGAKNPQGPVAIGELEWETLRIESGTTRYGKELLAGDKDSKIQPPSPLELHLSETVDTEKGCYLGQEGVSSILNNPRGPPRQLYQVVFPDESNLYDSDDKKNPTTLPKVGDDLFVLGSNEEISVGTITSLAEPGSSGDPVMFGLALARRADSVLKSMESRGLAISTSEKVAVIDIQEGGSGMITPLPSKIAPLDGLEVIIGGSFTIGTLRAAPNLKYRMQNMFSDDVPEFVDRLPKDDDDDETQILMANRSRQPDGGMAIDMPTELTAEDFDEASIQEAITKARQDAEEAAKEADRKAEKMAMLEKRAADAMARRKAAKEEAKAAASETPVEEANNQADKEAEAKRKAEKMAMLQKRAEEAIARRNARKLDNEKY